ncbi:hypothetical protein LC040_08290 [Bacillus tianshenii]|nr:hypothetical protein LC040_08290 [Bacillus tianshenii]
MNKTILGASVLAASLFLSACADEEAEQPQDEPKEEVTQQEEEQPQQQEEQQSEETNKEGKIAQHEFYQPFDGSIEHIHGLGYAGNQDALFLATHHGVKVYENGSWYETKENHHDYMGFTPVDKGFFTSGHPEEGSELPNPIGLKRSFDNGQTLEDVGFEGQSDFHALAAGYNNHALYVYNAHENKKIGQGLFVSKDDGKTWNEINIEQLGEQIFAIAAHPTDEKVLAVSGKDGVFLSTDGGETFNSMKPGRQGTAVYFTENSFYYGTFKAGNPSLTKYSLSDKSEETVALPEIQDDAVMYFTQNPKDENEMAFVTFNGNVYFTDNGTENWQTIVEQGALK